MKIYLSKDGQQQGPFNMHQVRHLLYQGHYNSSDHACRDGRWIRIAQLPGLFLTEEDDILSVSEKDYYLKPKPWTTESQKLNWVLGPLFIVAQILGSLIGGGIGIIAVCVLFGFLFFILRIASKGEINIEIS